MLPVGSHSLSSPPRPPFDTISDSDSEPIKFIHNTLKARETGLQLTLFCDPGGSLIDRIDVNVGGDI